MHLLHPALRPLVLAAVVFPILAVAPAQAKTEASVANRPTVAIVKRGLARVWAQPKSGETITLTYRTLRLMPTRRAVPYRDFIESGKWVTPVVAVFDQKTVSLTPNILTGEVDRWCRVYRVNFTGIFWRGDFGWEFKNRNVTARRIIDSSDAALPNC